MAADLCYVSYYHILLPVHIMPWSVYFKIVFSVLKKYKACKSGASLRGLYICDCTARADGEYRSKQRVFVSFLDIILVLYQLTLVVWKAEISSLSYCTVVGSGRLMHPDALQPKAYYTNPGL